MNHDHMMWSIQIKTCTKRTEQDGMKTYHACLMSNPNSLAHENKLKLD